MKNTTQIKKSDLQNDGIRLIKSIEDRLDWYFEELKYIIHEHTKDRNAV